MRQLGVRDWLSFGISCQPMFVYRKYVTTLVVAASLSEWQQAAARHKTPYNCFQKCPPVFMHSMCHRGLSWTDLTNVRSWCRFRIGLIDLRHVEGRRSDARYQNCTFCRKSGVKNMLKHNLALCERWADVRGQLVEMHGWDGLDADELTLRLLGVGPEFISFSAILTWMATVDDSAAVFWASR